MGIFLVFVEIARNYYLDSIYGYDCVSCLKIFQINNDDKLSLDLQ